MAEQVSIQQAFEDTIGAKEKPSSEQDAFDQWKTSQDGTQLRNVVMSLKPVIDSAVSQYVGQKAAPTIRQRANILAADAVKSFDPTRGASLKTHVYNQLRRLQRMAPGVVDPLAPPERFRRQQVDIKQGVELLQEEMGRDPTDEEVADLLGMPSARVTKVRNRMRARMPMSVYEEASSDDDTAPDIVGSTRTPYDEWIDAVYHDLGEIDRLILMYRTGYRNSDVLSNQEIANRLSISPAAVSQRANRIQRKLDSFHAPSR